MGAAPLIALTGATGFVGRQLLEDLAQRSVNVRALARSLPGRPLPAATSVNWIKGDLSSEVALADLVSGADTVIHLAGATKARKADDFHRINALSTADLVRHARLAGVRHFVHVSSLTAERPEVSDYAHSKAESETLAAEQAGEMALTIVRAPAVLGPGDDATQALFSALARGLLPVPGGAAAGYRFSVIDVADLSKFLLSLASGPDSNARTITPAGHLNLGWSDITRSAERIISRPIRRIVMPPLLMKMAGQAADVAVKLGGAPQVFSGGKVKELLSGDWIAGMQVPDAKSLDETLERCLMPFLSRPGDGRGIGKERA